MVNVHRGNRKFYTVNGTESGHKFMMKLNKEGRNFSILNEMSQKTSHVLKRFLIYIVKNDQDFDDDNLLIDNFP